MAVIRPTIAFFVAKGLKTAPEGTPWIVVRRAVMVECWQIVVGLGCNRRVWGEGSKGCGEQKGGGRE